MSETEMTELLCLKWNNHNLSFNRLLNHICLKDVYSDATLVCHGKFYPIHRFVLSNCSDYFLEIFAQSIKMKCKHPFIIVQDVLPVHLEALLSYMYKGEVSVTPETLPDFLKAAEGFRVKGLAVADDSESINESETGTCMENKRSSSSSAPSPKRSRGENGTYKSCNNCVNDFDQNNMNNSGGLDNIFSDNPECLGADVKMEPPEFASLSKADMLQLNHSDNYDMMLSHEGPSVKDENFQDFHHCNINPDDSTSIAQVVNMCHVAFTEDNSTNDWDSENSFQKASCGSILKYTCATCSFQCNSKFNMKRHIVIKHTTDKPYKCQYCPYQCASEDSLRTHTRKHTGEKPFTCPHCPYKATQNVHLRTHLRTHTGEKPFQCSHCPFKSSQKYSLNFHMKKHEIEDIT